MVMDDFNLIQSHQQLYCISPSLVVQWQKVRSILRFVGTHYLEDFDFFYQGGDDMYLLPENLRSFLADQVSDPTTEDYFGGRRFKQIGKGRIFNTGGPGYALSQATLRKLNTTSLDKCSVNSRTSEEDVYITQCLKDFHGIDVVDTRDDQERERFHHFTPGWQYNWEPKKSGHWGKWDWYGVYTKLWPPKLREDCCAPDTISFHFMQRPATVRHLHALLYFCGEQQ